jgi:hypothetical protein
VYYKWEPDLRFHGFSGYPFAVEWQQQGCHSKKHEKITTNSEKGVGMRVLPTHRYVNK